MGFFCLVGVSLGCICYYLSIYLICYLFGICVFTACSFYSSEVMTFFSYLLHESPSMGRATSAAATVAVVFLSQLHFSGNRWVLFP